MIKGLFADQTNSFNGAFSILTINRHFKFQKEFKDFKKASISALSTRDDQAIGSIKTMSKSTNKSLRTTSVSFQSDPISKTQTVVTIGGNGSPKTAMVCIDWYLVTTFPDGTQFWEFLYQTCSDDCEQTGIGETGKIEKVKVQCNRGNSGVTCGFTESDGAYLLGLTEYEESTSLSGAISVGEEYIDPPTGNIQKDAIIPPWQFFTVRIHDYGATWPIPYTAIYTGIVYRTSTTDYWKWKSATYVKTMQTGGTIPFCYGVSLTVAPQGMVTSDDGKSADIILKYACVVSITCFTSSQVGPAQSSTVKTSLGVAH